MIEIARIATLVLGATALIGGIIGFVKAKSKPSLISGVASLACLAAAYMLSISHERLGLAIADGVALSLYVFFHIRYNRTKKPMPAIPMMIISCAAIALITLGLAEAIKLRAGSLL